MRKLLLLIALLLFCVSDSKAAPREFSYEIRGQYTAKDKEIIEKSLVEGWKVLNELVEYRLTPTVFKQGKKDPTIIVEMERTFYREDWFGNPIPNMCPAATYYQTNTIEVYYTWFKNKSSVDQDRIIAHELAHLFFRLEDQYTNDYHYTTDNQPGCLMGYTYKQWDGKLCGKCKEQVDLIFKKRKK
jgi:hypothetical protein